MIRYKNGVGVDSWCDWKYVSHPGSLNGETVYIGSYKNNCIEDVHNRKNTNKKQKNNLFLLVNVHMEILDCWDCKSLI